MNYKYVIDFDLIYATLLWNRRRVDYLVYLDKLHRATISKIVKQALNLIFGNKTTSEKKQ